MKRNEAPRQISAERIEILREFCQRLGVLTSVCPSISGTISLVNEAVTHTSAGLGLNHERLEFLGDAVLRLAASEYIEKHHSELSVGERSALRAQLVSDHWLSSLGAEIKIDDVQLVGKKAKGDAAGRATLRAEATEALIGAIYQGWGSLGPILQWLSPHWQLTSAVVLSDPNRGNAKSCLQEWSQARKWGLPIYRSCENNQKHGHPERFHCQVDLRGQLLGEGWGGSRRKAEQEAAKAALLNLKNKKEDH